tara:strand:+ start:128 stop:850 length:723 start_codon:yes stop_codon:yes gene_type:complete
MEKLNKFSILIPVFNEGELIKETIEKILKNVKSNYELIICYDFDEDNTIQIIKENFKDSRILFVKNLKSGFNSAIITGIKKTNSDAVLIYMADDNVNSEIINDIFNKYNEGYEVVCPSRFIKNGKLEGGPFFKSLLTKFASFILYNFLSFPVKDATNSFRLFSRSLLNNIKFESSRGFTLSFEITAKAHRLNYKMVEIPTKWKEREKGKSRFKLLSFLPLYLKWFFYIINTQILKLYEKK